MKRKWQQLVTLLSVAVVAVALVWVMGGLASADHGVIDFDNFDTATNTHDGFFFAFSAGNSIVAGQAVLLEEEEEGDGLEVSRVDGGTFDVDSIVVVSCDNQNPGAAPCEVKVTDDAGNSKFLGGTGTLIIGFSSITAFTVVPTGQTTRVDDIVVIVTGDTDGDGVDDVADNCVNTANADQADVDFDGVGDACDNEPSNPNPGQEDADGDGVGDNIDLCSGTASGVVVDGNGCSDAQVDADGDGVCDPAPPPPSVGPLGCTGSDAFPNDPTETTDSDGDGVGNNKDICSETPAGEPVDGNGCSDAQRDTDRDGVVDDNDLCFGTASGASVDVNGCSDAQVDADGDGVCDPGPPPSVGPLGCTGSDAFPNDATETTDSDGDGLGDNSDLCSGTASGASVDGNGCSDAQRDTDGDGVVDANDLCFETPAGEPVDANGCADAQVDADGDGVCDPGPLPSVGPSGCTGSDAFPNDATETTDSDGDGVGDNRDLCSGTGSGVVVDGNGCADTDGDGIADNIDRFPFGKSSAFGDIDIGGKTFGFINTRGNQTLTLVEETNPAGVRITSTSGGAQPAIILMVCGGPTTTVSIDAGESLVVTCGSVTLTILVGPVDATLVGDDGTVATVSLNSGFELTFDPETLEFSAPSDNPGDITILVDGSPVVVAPGTGGGIASVNLDLREIVADNPGTELADKLDDAIAKLDVAAAELDKTPPDNQAGLGNIEGAVGEIEAAVSSSLLDADVGVQLMDRLAGVARRIAENGLNEAIAQVGSTDVINDAQDALEEGDGLRKAGAYKDAVNKFKDALAKAESAL